MKPSSCLPQFSQESGHGGELCQRGRTHIVAFVERLAGSNELSPAWRTWGRQVIRSEADVFEMARRFFSGTGEAA